MFFSFSILVVMQVMQVALWGERYNWGCELKKQIFVAVNDI